MISIIGSGPVGSYCASLLSKKGFSVKLFDEKSKIGVPVQCTGLLTKDFLKFFKKHELSEFVINKIDSIKLNSPNGYNAIIPTTEYVVDRVKFDNFLLNKAIENGAEVILKHKYVSNKNGSVIFSNNNKIKYDHLIGADGPQSRVAQVNNMYGNRKFLLGIQARVHISSQHNQYSVFFDQEKYPGFFAWQVPESETIARVGVAGINPKMSFDLLLKKLNVNKVLECQGGLIPMYNSKQKFQNKNIVLVGDSALQVKATTGGGIVPGFTAARYLVKSLMNGTSYNESSKKLKLKLYSHMKLRHMLDNFSNDDYNHMTQLLKQKKLAKILKTNSRDNILSLSLKLALKEPRLLFFCKNLFK